MAPRMKDCRPDCTRENIHPAPYHCYVDRLEDTEHPVGCFDWCQRTDAHPARLGCSLLDAKPPRDEMQRDMDDVLRSTLRRQYAERASREFFGVPGLDRAQKITEDTPMGRPALIDIFHPALVRANDILRKKSEDYGTVGDYAKERYFPFGHKSYLQMIHTKVERLVSVVAQGDCPSFESIDDTLLDLINYSAFYWAWIQEDSE